LFCVFDGHAGPEAAISAKKLIPREFLNQLQARGSTLPNDISDIFPLTFLKVDEQMANHDYEGCTATTVLIWQNESGRFVQSANVGDSRAYLCRADGSAVRLTKDHKLGDDDEKARMMNIGVSVTEGQTRINGLAVSRALGDRFAKSTNSGIIAVPYVSEVIKLTDADRYIVVASDGLWDIVSGQKACEICLTVAETTPTAEAMAQTLLSTAVQSNKSVDNVTVIVAIL